MVWPCKVDWSTHCLQLCCLICTNSCNTNIGNTQVTNTYRGMVQIVRSKLDSVFFSFAIHFHSDCTQNFSCWYAMWKCRNIPTVASVHFRFMPLHMCVAAVYLVVCSIHRILRNVAGFILTWWTRSYPYLLDSSKTHWDCWNLFFSCQVCCSESIVLITLHIHAYLAVTPMINGSSISVL